MSLSRGGRSRLWAITSYFNPMGYDNRLANYRVFREKLAVPLVTVEISFNGRSDLREGDADILVRLRGDDVLWQKERLLNIALRNLPAECDTVAWIDCDVVFDSDDWTEKICLALADFPMVQAFRKIHLLQVGATPDGRTPTEGADARDSIVYRMQEGTLPSGIFREVGMSRKHGCSPGYAWAARRELIEKHNFYDSLIIGGGDKALYAAAYGKIAEVTSALYMNDIQSAHYREWATSYHDSIRGCVGYVDAVAYHLWHGHSVDRRYKSRHREFACFRFDPRTDIAADENGIWWWNSDKPGMHDYVLDYFRTRREDG